MSTPNSNPARLSAPSEDQGRWFAEQVYPHRSSLRAYLAESFPNLKDVDDVVQDSCLRVWKARAAHPIESAKAFLFRVARHAALDLVRRAKSSPVETVGDLAAVSVIDEVRGVAESASINEKVRLLVEAVASLPTRCREVVILRKLRGLSQREVAVRLGISEKTVEEQVSRGVRTCETYLRARHIRSYYE